MSAWYSSCMSCLSQSMHTVHSITIINFRLNLPIFPFRPKFVATESQFCKCDPKCATYVAPQIWLNVMIFLQHYTIYIYYSVVSAHMRRLSIDVCTSLFKINLINLDSLYPPVDFPILNTSSFIKSEQ